MIYQTKQQTDQRLSLPVNVKHHWSKYFTPAILTLGLLVIYLSTLSPTVYLGDSGELTAAAFCLGIPHNSGYPLYCLLGKLFSLIPVGHIGFRINLMSAVFGILAVLLVYSLVLRLASSQLSALVGALVFAFTPIFWFQTVCAEVYTLHTFFVALLIRLLWWWDENRTFCRLALFVFVTGISFGNHMQTVMLAPAVLFIILSADYKTLVNFKNFSALSVLFVFALCVYLYLPVRTDAGSAIHWGDPNTLDRFLAHVTARDHREGYVLTRSSLEYLLRAKQILWFVISQFGFILPLAVWGWAKSVSARWQIFFLAVIFFDFLYSVFLNIISIEITPFGLPSCVALAVLIGMGTGRMLQAVRRHPSIGKTARKAVSFAVCMVPAIPLTFNYDYCDQSRNYTGYEHALNIFRTVEEGGTLFLDGDNNIFPVVYGRIAEGMREDVTLYDRYNLFFKMPHLEESEDPTYTLPEKLRPTVEKRIIENIRKGIYYAVFNPFTISLPNNFAAYPYGILYDVTQGSAPLPHDALETIWTRYVTESIYDDEFQKDFMNRQVGAYFHFAFGKYLFKVGRPDQGLRRLELASRVGYDDTTIHSDIGVFLTDQGFFEEAKRALERALVYHEDLSGIYNNWGYFYHNFGDHDKAEASYREAISLRPKNHGYYNNLGLALYDAGRKDEARKAFQRSLDIDANQPELRRFLTEKGLKEIIIR